VSVDEWERLSPGDRRRIRALLGEAIETRISPNSHWPGVAAFGALGLILIAVGTLVLVLGIREIRRQRAATG